MDGWMDGWMDVASRQTDKQADINIYISIRRMLLNICLTEFSVCYLYQIETSKLVFDNC